MTTQHLRQHTHLWEAVQVCGEKSTGDTGEDGVWVPRVVKTTVDTVSQMSIYTHQLVALFRLQNATSVCSDVHFLIKHDDATKMYEPFRITTVMKFVGDANTLTHVRIHYDTGPGLA